MAMARPAAAVAAAKEAHTEEERGLRSLPDWLLSGASADAEGRTATSEVSDEESMHGEFK